MRQLTKPGEPGGFLPGSHGVPRYRSAKAGAGNVAAPG